MPVKSPPAAVRKEDTAKYVRIPSRKVHIVLDLIRGKSADQALAILMNTPKAAAPIVAKVLNSAIANAENNLELDRSTLYVAECYANQVSILKRSSHITVVLDQK